MKLSIVDVSTVSTRKTRQQALQRTIELAQLAEKLGYERYWVAEHHGASFAAGRAPEALIAAIAANTKTIKVGSGAVLLNHYSPFKVAEVFCTLNELYPGRIDLGVGRATTGPITDFALQQDRSQQFRADSDQQIMELVAWLEDSFPKEHPFSNVPIHTIFPKPNLYLLGSSAWSASAAARLGLPYVFAGFINQMQAHEIISSYRNNYQSRKGSSSKIKPHVILALHVVCAESEKEAARQLAPVHIMYRYLSKGILNAEIPSPDEAIYELGAMPRIQKYTVGSNMPPKFIGGNPESVKQQLNDIAHDFEVDEIMIQDIMTDPAARLRSYELMAEIIK